jgi:hypothetical protein
MIKLGQLFLDPFSLHIVLHGHSLTLLSLEGSDLLIEVVMGELLLAGHRLDKGVVVLGLAARDHALGVDLPEDVPACGLDCQVHDAYLLEVVFAVLIGSCQHKLYELARKVQTQSLFFTAHGGTPSVSELKRAIIGELLERIAVEDVNLPGYFELVADHMQSFDNAGPVQM